MGVELLAVGLFIGGVALTGVLATLGALLQMGVLRPEFMRAAHEKVPGFPMVRQKTAKGKYSAKETAEALKIFRECWEEAFGPVEDFDKKVYKNLDIIYLDDVIELNRQYTVNGITYSKASGITDTPWRIRVWIRDEDLKDDKKIPREHKLSDTALLHELIHVALWKLNGVPDYDHEGDLEKGWTKEHTQKVEVLGRELLLKKGL